MELWNLWIEAISTAIGMLGSQLGVSEAVAIIALTLLARLALMPISFQATLSMYKNKLAMEKIKPELEKLREVYAENPAELARRTMSLYRKRGIRFFDKNSLLNMGSQGLVGISLFQSLRNMVFSSPFGWIANISKPDVLLAMLAGLLTFISTQLMPGSAEQHSMLIFLLPAIVSTLVLVSMPSAIALYWVTSNIVTVCQNLLVREFVNKGWGTGGAS